MEINFTDKFTKMEELTVWVLQVKGTTSVRSSRSVGRTEIILIISVGTEYNHLDEMVVFMLNGVQKFSISANTTAYVSAIFFNHIHLVRI